MNVIRKIGISLLVLAALGAVILLPVGNSPAAESLRASAGAQTDSTTQSGIFVGEPVEPELTIALRDAPLAGPGDPLLDREINPRINFTGGADPNFRQEFGVDPLLAAQLEAPTAAMPITVLHNFAGQGYTSVTPPDTVGEVGMNEYIQMINHTSGSSVTIYNKDTGAVIAGPIILSSLGTGGNCATGLGDPIVLYDELADRWMLSEFSSSGNQLCVYISTTPDPTGTYYRYAFTATSFPDYPKYAVWPDAYYVTSNESSPTIYALDRTNMIIGGTARPYVRFTAPDLSAFGFQTLTPADFDGNTAPPAGSPGIIMRHRDTEAHGPAGSPTTDLLEIWAFHVDWNVPANSTFTQLPNIVTSEFTSELNGYTAFSCFPQQGSGTELDPLREVIMWRLQYRNFGTYETLVGNFVTDVNDYNDHGGIRWFELRKTGAGAWSLYQEGTYAPDIHSRWMGGSAMDGSGNIAVGYNVSSTTMYPSLRYIGRLRTDPLGTMPYDEMALIAGSAANGSNRYGDYSAMSVDPEDDCTFWFTGEYNAGSSWSTRIGAFKFNSCTGGLGPDFVLEVTPASQAICAPDPAVYSLDIDSFLGFADPVTLTAYGVPAETTHAFSPNPATPPVAASLAITTTSLTPAGSYNIDIVGTTTTRTHTTTVTLDVYAGMPAIPTLQLPADGAANQVFAPTLDWADQGNTQSYNLQLGLSPLFETPLVSVTDLGDSDYTVAGPLDGGICYWWRTQAANLCSVGDWAEPFHFSTVALQAAFADDMESGSTQWTHGFLVGQDQWVNGTTQSHSPTHAWFTPDRNALNDSYLRLANPVSVGAGSTLTFWHMYWFEGTTYDGSVLEISTNGGTSWSDLGAAITSGGYNGTISTSYSNPLGGRSAWTGDLTTWTQVTVNLNAYAGQNILIRWRLGTDSSVGDTGWYIDDVQITAPLPPNPAPGLTTITPAEGSSFASTSVQISGSNFVGSPALRLGNTWLESVIVTSPTLIDAVVPAGLPAGTYDLVLYNGDCQETTLLGAFTVIGVTIPPEVIDDEAITDEDVAVAIDVLDNDNDPAGIIGLSLEAVGAPLHGTAAISGTLALYTPALDFFGTDVFTYTAFNGLSSSGVVTVTVQPVNDAPGSVAQTVNTNEDASAAITLAASDVENDPLTWDFSNPTHGVLTGTAPNLTYAPEANWFGTDTFTFIVNDGLLDSNIATVTIIVAPVNDAPIMAPGSLTVDPAGVWLNQVFTLNGSLTDADPDDAHTVIITWATGITETINLPAGVFVFSAQHTYLVGGTQTISVTVYDVPAGEIATLELIVNVRQTLYITNLPMIRR